MSRINEILGSTQLSLLWICAIAAVMVFVALMYSTATFRHENSALGARFKAGREVIWAVVPIFIVIGAALPAMTMAVPTRGDESLVNESREACTMVLADSSSSQHSPTATTQTCSKHR